MSYADYTSPDFTYVPGVGPVPTGRISVFDTPVSTPTPTPVANPTPTVSPAAESAITGFDPAQLAAVSYGKVLPVFFGGMARIGGVIMGGPHFDGTTASFGISFGFSGNPTGSKQLREIALDSKAVWTIDDGFLGDTFTFEFMPGTYTQAPSALETAQWAENAVAYRPQMLLFFENLDLTQYNGKIPYVAALIGDDTDGADPADGVNLGEVLERIAFSPWVGLTPDTFETEGITDIVQALIIAEDKSFLELLQDLNQVYRTWNILQGEKLRVFDRAADLTPDITLNRDHIIGPVKYTRQAPASIPRELELITIDPGADYMMVPAIARRPNTPVQVSGATGKKSLSLPIAIDATTRQSLVTHIKFSEERARLRAALTATSFAMEVEPGDLVALENIVSGIDYEVFKVIEATHQGNYQVAMELELILRCAIGAVTDPQFENVLVLIGGNGSDGSTTVIDEGNEHKTITVHGDAHIDADVSKFGSGSVRFDGSGDWLGFTFGDTDFDLQPMWTFEAFVRFASIAGEQSLFGVWNTPVSGYQLRYNNGSGVLEWFCFGGTYFTAAWSPDVETWYHVAIDRDGTTTRIYVDGVMLGSTLGVQSGFANIDFSIGVASQYFNGWMDEFRFSSGVARYGSDDGYTVPTSAFPRS